MNLNRIRQYQPCQVAGGGAGGGADISYIRATPLTATLGGAQAGFLPNGTVQDMLDVMLYPYLVPGFTLFQIAGLATVVEVGTSYAAAGRATHYTILNAGNVQAGSVKVFDNSELYGTILGSGISDNASVNYPAIGPLGLNQTKTFVLQGRNSKGNYFTTSYQVGTLARRFAGTVPAASLAALEAVQTYDQLIGVPGIALTNTNLVSSRGLAATYDCTGGRYVFVFWPSHLGAAVGWTSGAAPAAMAAEIGKPDYTNQNGATIAMRLQRSSNVFNGLAVQLTLL